MKKFTFFIASLFIAIGAMAQTPITVSEFSTNDVYRIYNTRNGETTVRAFAPNTDATMGALTEYNKEDEAQEWILIEKDSKYLFFNLSTSKYLQGVYGSNGVSMTSDVNSAVAYTMTTEEDENGAGLFIFNHADNQTNYLFNDGGGKLAGWTGNNNEKFYLSYVRTLSQEIELTYYFVYNGDTKYTEKINGFVGEAYPSFNTKLPFGVVASALDGKVSTDDTEKTIELSLNVPFGYASSYESIEHWYYMNIRDDGPTYLAYNSEKEYIPATVSSVDASNKDIYTWAFIGDPFNGFQIVNYAAGETMILSAPEAPTGDKNAAQLARMVTKEGAAGNTTWMFYNPTHTNPATNCFYIQHPTAASYAFNRQDYDETRALCYWTGRDTGSAIQLVERPMGAVAELEALVAEITAANIVAGENIGDYSAASVDALNAAVEAANALIEAETATESNVTELQAAYDALAINLPATNKVYAFNVYYNGFGTYMYSKIDGTSTNIYTRGESKDDTKALWQFIAVEGGYNIKNVHTGLFIGEGVTMTDDANNYALFEITKTNVENGTSNSAEEGKVFIKFAGETNYHCLHSYNRETVISWEGSGLGNQIGIEEVSEFSHTLTVSDAGLATLTLGFNTTIPAGVECYYATEAIDERGVLNLTQVDGNVLPANTPVIVKAAANDYEFAYTDAAATAPEDNLLSGTLYTKDMTATGSVYVLAVVDDNVGLYQDELTDGVFRNYANKTYLALTASTAASYSFNFDWAGTTGVEGVVAEGAENGAIYDITGRRVKAITAPGLYIINGVKVVK